MSNEIAKEHTEDKPREAVKKYAWERDLGIKRWPQLLAVLPWPVALSVCPFPHL